MARRIRFGHGGAEVELEPSVHEMVDRMLRGAPGRVLDTIEGSMEQIVAAARERWPVSKRRKGTHSRDELDFHVRIVPPDSVEGVALNAADYAYYIRSWKNGLLGKSPWQELVRKPTLGASRQLAKDIAADLVALADGRS